MQPQNDKISNSWLEQHLLSRSCCLKLFAIHFHMPPPTSFHFMCPCDDTLGLKQEMWSDISAHFCLAHLSFKDLDMTREAEKEKIRKARHPLKHRSTCRPTTCFSETISPSQETKPLMFYEIQYYTKAGDKFAKMDPLLLTFSFRTTIEWNTVCM